MVNLVWVSPDLVVGFVFLIGLIGGGVLCLGLIMLYRKELGQDPNSLLKDGLTHLESILQEVDDMRLTGDDPGLANKDQNIGYNMALDDVLAAIRAIKKLWSSQATNQH